MKLKHLSILLSALLMSNSAFAQEYYTILSKKSNIVIEPSTNNTTNQTTQEPEPEPEPQNTNNAVGFENDYAPSNWAASGVAGMNFNQSALNISVGSGGGGKSVSITVLNTGVITFDWAINVYSAGAYGDSIRYDIDGNITTLSSAGTNSGSVAGVVVNAGQTFQFSTWGSTQSSSYTASISNFTFTEQ